jgi:hypothetical protein
MKSVPPRGSGWVSGKELRLIEHGCNGHTRYRACVETKKADVNSQVRKGGMPPPERQRRDWLAITWKLWHSQEKRALKLESVVGSLKAQGDDSRCWRSGGGMPPFLTCELTLHEPASWAC